MTVKLYVKFYVHRFITVFIVVAAAYKIKEKKTIFFISKYSWHIFNFLRSFITLMFRNCTIAFNKIIVNLNQFEQAMHQLSAARGRHRPSLLRRDRLRPSQDVDVLLIHFL